MNVTIFDIWDLLAIKLDGNWTRTSDNLLACSVLQSAVVLGAVPGTTMARNYVGNAWDICFIASYEGWVALKASRSTVVR